MRKSKFTDEQIIGILKQAEAGAVVTDLCRQHGISGHICYRWRSRFGGVEVNKARRPRQIEDENRELMQIVADISLENRALERSRKTGESAQRRELVRSFVEDFDLSERRACAPAGLSRAVKRHQADARPDTDLRVDLGKLAAERPGFRYRRLGILLRRRGKVICHKRLWRVNREEGLVVGRKKRKRIAAADRETRTALTGANRHWSMDYRSDALGSGRGVRLFNVVDDWARFPPVTELDLSLMAGRVVRELERAGELYGFPKSHVCDNASEFTSCVLQDWTYGRGVETVFTRPGKAGGERARRALQRTRA